MPGNDVTDTMQVTMPRERIGESQHSLYGEAGSRITELVVLLAEQLFLVLKKIDQILKILQN